MEIVRESVYSLSHAYDTSCKMQTRTSHCVSTAPWPLIVLCCNLILSSEVSWEWTVILCLGLSLLMLVCVSFLVLFAEKISLMYLFQYHPRAAGVLS
jgi:hypothetical protein